MEALLTLNSQLRYSITQDNKIRMYKYDSSIGYFVRMYDLSELANNRILINAVGFKRYLFDSMDEELSIPDKFITALIYYIRHSIYLENGNPEMSKYYYSMFINAIRSNTSNVQAIKSEPSEYSLR